MPQISADQFFEVLQQDKTSFHRNLTFTSEIDVKIINQSGKAARDTDTLFGSDFQNF